MEGPCDKCAKATRSLPSLSRAPRKDAQRSPLVSQALGSQGHHPQKSTGGAGKERHAPTDASIASRPAAGTSTSELSATQGKGKGKATSRSASRSSSRDSDHSSNSYFQGYPDPPEFENGQAYPDPEFLGDLPDTVEDYVSSVRKLKGDPAVAEDYFRDMWHAQLLLAFDVKKLKSRDGPRKQKSLSPLIPDGDAKLESAPSPTVPTVAILQVLFDQAMASENHRDTSSEPSRYGGGADYRDTVSAPDLESPHHSEYEGEDEQEGVYQRGEDVLAFVGPEEDDVESVKTSDSLTFRPHAVSPGSSTSLQFEFSPFDRVPEQKREDQDGRDDLYSAWPDDDTVERNEGSTVPAPPSSPVSMSSPVVLPFGMSPYLSPPEYPHEIAKLISTDYGPPPDPNAPRPILPDGKTLLRDPMLVGHLEPMWVYVDRALRRDGVSAIKARDYYVSCYVALLHKMFETPKPSTKKYVIPAERLGGPQSTAEAPRKPGMAFDWPTAQLSGSVIAGPRSTASTRTAQAEQRSLPANDAPASQLPDPPPRPRSTVDTRLFPYPEVNANPPEGVNDYANRVAKSTVDRTAAINYYWLYWHWNLASQFDQASRTNTPRGPAAEQRRAPQSTQPSQSSGSGATQSTVPAWRGRSASLRSRGTGSWRNSGSQR
ncbi:uncharacterized protein LTR77_000450 [Saxophila tyrrhenica]|uniref:Uncharacterized protein n=1 Tax=Saxophila tyrrhenica TaxID=1690608 RepID=A0AAV9PQV4_9PEZI|nr:hypothetical protein LTR77_000450 [Saxophila tyrrhenica]